MVEISNPKNGRLLLASAIIYMAASSGEISKEQWGQLHSVVGTNEKLLKDAMEKVRETSIDDFLAELKEELTSDEQKLCVLLNVFDSMLADERMTTEENIVFSRFKEALIISSPELEMFFKALKIKNNIPILDAN
jgi:hypothetical protein